MFTAVQVIKYIVKKYITATPITIAERSFKLPEIESSKFAVFVAPTGSKIPEINFNPSSQIAIDKIGSKLIKRIISDPTNPIAFLTIMLPALTSSNPSEIYPPRIGT